MEEWKVGDRVRSAIPRPIGEVTKIHFNGQITVRWPSGYEAVVTRPAELEKVED